MIVKRVESKKAQRIKSAGEAYRLVQGQVIDMQFLDKAHYDAFISSGLLKQADAKTVGAPKEPEVIEVLVSPGSETEKQVVESIEEANKALQENPDDSGIIINDDDDLDDSLVDGDVDLDTITSVSSASKTPEAPSTQSFASGKTLSQEEIDELVANNSSDMQEEVVDKTVCPICGKRKAKSKPLCNKCLKAKNDNK